MHHWLERQRNSAVKFDIHLKVRLKQRYKFSLLIITDCASYCSCKYLLHPIETNLWKSAGKIINIRKRSYNFTLQARNNIFSCIHKCFTHSYKANTQTHTKGANLRGEWKCHSFPPPGKLGKLNVSEKNVNMDDFQEKANWPLFLLFYQWPI